VAAQTSLTEINVTTNDLINKIPKVRPSLAYSSSDNGADSILSNIAPRYSPTLRKFTPFTHFFSLRVLNCPLFDTARSRVYVTAWCPSARLSVCLSVPSIGRCSSLRRVCCWAPRGQEISIDGGRRWAPRSNSAAAARRSAANASSVAFTTGVKGWARTCFFGIARVLRAVEVGGRSSLNR